MKKLLILAYDFPPYVSVGGLRPHAWYKYLREFGIEPIVVTRQWSNKHGNALDYISPSESSHTIEENNMYGTIIRAPFKPSLSNRLLLQYGSDKFKFIRKALTAFDEIRQFITISGPKKTLYTAARNYLQQHKVDAIIATGEPFVLFYFAQKLSAEFNTPWIADYRDTWSQDENRSRNTLLYQWNNRIEKRLLATTQHIVTVSPFLQLQIQKNAPTQQFHIITNGYDPDVMNELAQRLPNKEQLSIAFVGTIYKWHPWQSFITRFSKVVEASSETMALRFYGTNLTAEIQTFLASFPPKTQAAITFSPKLSNKELLQELTGNHVMLLFNYYSFMGTKIYDYLGIKRRIILCYENDKNALALKEKFYPVQENESLSKTLQADLLRETQAGIAVKDEDHLETVLKDLLAEFTATRNIECNSINTDNYSRKIQVKKLAEIISAI
ncbi:MAG: glycosyltransferase [Chitinophagales bacterium]|nr:glycosyltransferase [Chitinophagales bacterium]